MSKGVYLGESRDRDNPSEVDMRQQIIHMLLGWSNRIGFLDKLKDRMFPHNFESLKSCLNMWERMHGERLQELEDEHIYYDLTQNPTLTSNGFSDQTSLQGLDDPEVLRKVWKEIAFLDWDLGRWEKLARKDMDLFKRGIDKSAEIMKEIEAMTPEDWAKVAKEFGTDED
jgi:hypothetical protein